MSSFSEQPPVPARPPIQLKMNFSGENPLAAALRAGRFVTLLELNTPPAAQPLEAALAPAVALARRSAAAPEITGLAVTDRLKAEESHDPVAAAALLGEAAGKPVLMTLSGKGSTRERLRDVLARAASHGIRNILAVSGDRSDKHEVVRDVLGRPRPYPPGYFDSPAALGLIRSFTTGLYAGAGVNPFKYHPADQYLQYFKMLRKLHGGAQFLVTHAGWDMKKYQELQWFLQMREISWPVLARIPLLAPGEIERIHERWQPGVHASRRFYAMLQRESSLNPAQGLAAQLTRVGLQVAGCKLLGYSGVQLTGIRDVPLLEMALAKIREALGQFRAWPDWVAAWNEFHNFIEFAPYSSSFYAFGGLLAPESPYYREGAGPAKGAAPPGLRPRGRDRLRARVFQIGQADWTPPWLHRTTQTLLGCHHCPHAGCGLELCYGLCPEQCPKGLASGACGGSFPDGTCEFGHAPCFHHRVLALAAARHELDRLEEGLPCD